MTKTMKLVMYRIIVIIILIIFLISCYQNIELKKKEKHEFLFLGDSITDRYDLQSHFSNYPIINSGIGGNKTIDILENLDNRVFKYNPDKLCLLIGINDFTHNEDVKYVYNNIDKIIRHIKKKFPKCEIYIQSIYPINDGLLLSDGAPTIDDILGRVVEENKLLEEYCKKNNYTYIDVYSSLIDENGKLKKRYTEDGIHLNEYGYKMTTYVIKKKMFY